MAWTGGSFHCSCVATLPDVDHTCASCRVQNMHLRLSSCTDDRSWSGSLEYPDMRSCRRRPYSLAGRGECRRSLRWLRIAQASNARACLCGGGDCLLPCRRDGDPCDQRAGADAEIFRWCPSSRRHCSFSGQRGDRSSSSGWYLVLRYRLMETGKLWGVVTVGLALAQASQGETQTHT